MTLSDKEQAFLVRGLDRATTPDEADTCAKNFFKLLRERGAESYKILAQFEAGADELDEEEEFEQEDEQEAHGFSEGQIRMAKAYSDYVGHENWKRQNEAREKGIPFQWCNISYEEFLKWYHANKDASGNSGGNPTP
jgi:hypothetical protein